MSLSAFLLFLDIAKAMPETTEVVERFGPLKVGDPIPTFAGWSTKDKPWSFSRDRSKRPLVLSYFATWCQPCLEGIPIIERVSKKQGADVILISIDEKQSKVKSFLKKHEFRSLTIVDTYKEIAKRHGVIQNNGSNSIPKTFLIDQQNIIRVIYTKEGKDFETLLQSNIEALQEPPPSTP